MNIRKASCQDSEVVSKLLKSKYSFVSEEEALQTFSDECRYNHFRMAEEDGHVVGIIGWQPEGILRHGVVELTRLAIDMNAHDPKQIREMLFDVMIAEADYFYKHQGYKLRKVFSMIHADCRHIKEFYENKGMRQEAVLRDHFHQGKDELVFSLFLA